MKVEDIKKLGNELLNKRVECKCMGLTRTGYITEVFNNKEQCGVHYYGVHVVFDNSIIWGDYEYCSHDFLYNIDKPVEIYKELETVKLI